MDSFAKRLLYLRDQRGMSGAELSRRTQEIDRDNNHKGVTPSSINDLEKGRSKAPSPNTLYLLATVLDSDPQWLSLGGRYDKDWKKRQRDRNQRMVPIIDWGDVAKSLSTQHIERKELEWIPCPVAKSTSTFAFIMPDDSMLPPFDQGCVIFIDPKVKPEPGASYVLASIDGEPIFRKLVSDAGKSVLMPTNTQYRTITEKFKRIGTAVAYTNLL